MRKGLIMRIRADSVVPINEFKASAASFVRQFAESDEPVVVTHNGHPAFVALSPTAFETLVGTAAVVKAIAEGIADPTALSDVELDELLAEEEQWVTLREAEARMGIKIRTLRQWSIEGNVSRRTENGLHGEQILVNLAELPERRDRSA